MNPRNHITSFVEVAAHSEYLKIEEESQSESHWMENHPAFQPINRLRADGRIIYGYSDGGSPIGTSVSPFIQEFHTQVEEDIAPVVMALKEKGYFTVSSCGGHPLRTLVTLCFPTVGERSEFAARIKELNLPTAKFEYTDFFFNVESEYIKGGSKLIKCDNDIDRSLDYYRSKEADLINLMFFRSYKEYVFLTITLLNDWNPIFHPIKAYQTWRALPNKSSIIAQLSNGIKSEDFPANGA